MDLPLTRAAVPHLTVVERTGSTNDDLRDRATDAPHFSVLVTDDQRAGRGRLGRQWIAPPGQTLAISVLLRPRFDLASYGWLPLAAGLAMVRAVRAVLPAREAGSALPAREVRLKWPNDPQVNERKVGGILAEVVPGVGVVVGAGINLRIPAGGLPTPTSTSLLVEGAELEGDALTDAVLSGYLAELRDAYRGLEAANGDAAASGLRTAVAAACATIGRAVRVELPSGQTLVGEAVGIDRDGRLEVRTADGSAPTAVAAGDVTHLRYE
jgi:BirA family biotin operon repressor/biotin-[acetyl-CoA-carboxylase] ligase